jgi:hypothetical protein
VQCEVIEIGSGSRSVVGFAISGVGNSGSVTRQVNKDGSSGNTLHLQSRGAQLATLPI